MDENKNENEVSYGVDPVNPENNGAQYNAPLEAEPVSSTQQEPKKETNGMAVGALVCGILSILSCCSGLVAFILSIAAIVLGVKGRKDSDGSSNGMAVAGLTCGIIGLIIAIIMLLLSAVLHVTFNALGEAATDGSLKDFFEGLQEGLSEYNT